MSQAESNARVDHDPLLEFSIEPGDASVPPPQLDQPVAAAGVSAAAVPAASSPDQDAALRARIDRLEKALDRSVTEIDALRSQVATLVGVTRDIKTARQAVVVKEPINIKGPRGAVRTHLGSDPASNLSTQSGSDPNHVLRRVVGAVAGIVLGVASGIWIWNSWPAEPIIPAAPMISPAAQPIVVNPDPPATEAPAIIPVAAVSPVRTTPPHESSRPTTNESSRPSTKESTRPINYVGTLSVDSDPAGDVFIDRKPAGRTPVVAKNLKAGSHLIWIERDGYRRFTRVVEVPADRVSRVVADLESAPQR